MVQAVVGDYFAMLDKELRGVAYSKTEHRRLLRNQLRDRSEGSIERKHQNISAILIAARFPYIRGYKPLGNFQGLLSDVVLEHLADDADLNHLAAVFAESVVTTPNSRDVLSLMCDPPDALEAARIALGGQLMRRDRRRIDYVARESANRTLGAAGEELVVRYERQRLSSLGHETLADLVEHVSRTQGDGLGYDVRSFSPDGHTRFIEVKTTQLGPFTPFYVTANELSFSADNPRDYSLYRVYDFTANRRMFSLHGSVNDTCSMTASQYLASPLTHSSHWKSISREEGIGN